MTQASTPPAGPAAKPSSEAIWHCNVSGQAYGPITLDQMMAWAAESRIGPATPVWTQGMPAWAPMGSIPDLVAELSRRNLPSAVFTETTMNNAGMRLILPVGRSGWAIASGYCGLLSIVPGLGVLAVIFGIMAIRDIRSHADRHGMGRAIFGILAGAVSLLLWTWYFVRVASDM